MLERIAEMIADLTENGIDGAAGLSLILGAVIVVLIFAIIRVRLNNEEED